MPSGRVEERTSELREANQQLEHEIAERKKAEEALRESQQRLDLALSGAGLGSWDWNLETRKAVFDKRWAEMLGFFSEEIEPYVSGAQLQVEIKKYGLWSSYMNTWKAVSLCSRPNTGSGPSQADGCGY